MFYNCDFCNKEFKISPCILKEKDIGKRKNITCSKECTNKLRKKNKIKITCINCNQEYEVQPSQKDSKFCSQKCKGQYSTKQAMIIINCKYCKKEFKVLKGQVTKGKKFCSNECSCNSRNTKVEKICVVCGEKYKTHFRRSEKSIVCSKKCHNKWLKEYSLSKIVNERLKKQGTNSMLNQKKTNTLPEIIVREYLIKKKITFIEQYSINEILIADFYLPKYNCILEVYGDYWHSNPKYYGDKENLKPLNKMQKKIKNKDIRRYKVLVNKLKYNFYSLWEDDIKNRLSQ